MGGLCGATVLAVRSYVALTLGGLAALGIGLVMTDPVWLGWVVVLAADVGYLILFLTDDIPPFVFYVLLLLGGIVI